MVRLTVSGGSTPPSSHTNWLCVFDPLGAIGGLNGRKSVTPAVVAPTPPITTATAGVSAPGSYHIECPTPPTAATNGRGSAVLVSVATTEDSSVDYTIADYDHAYSMVATAFPFRYTRRSWLSSAQPTSVSAVGGGKLRLNGYDIENTHLLTCAFVESVGGGGGGGVGGGVGGGEDPSRGSASQHNGHNSEPVYSRAEWISSTVAECLVPPSRRGPGPGSWVRGLL